MLDDEGVYYTVERKRYYVHDQVIVIAIKRGNNGAHQPPRRMRMYVTARGEPRVREYYFSGRKKATPEDTQMKEMLYATQTCNAIATTRPSNLSTDMPILTE